MSITGVIVKMVEKASKKDIGTAIKMIALGVFFLLLGACLSLVLYGQLAIDVQAEKAPEETEKAK